MTYCLAMRLNDGLVFGSDSRTNAGVDYVSTYSKMYTFAISSERFFVLLSAGNLATTQAVVNLIQRDLDDEDPKESLKNVEYLFDAAHYVGNLSCQVQKEHKSAMQQSGVNLQANFLLGGQIAGKPHDIFHIYSEGNYISASSETPYLQIGETKYGKPILDRLIMPTTSLEDGARCALVSLDSTMRSNISVGPPVEVGIYKKDSFTMGHYLNLTPTSPLFVSIQKRWGEGLKRAFEKLPRFDWES